MAIALYNGKFILLISVSFITIFSSIAIYFCLPILISHMIRIQVTLSPTSGSYNDWRLNSLIDRIYLYNITNYDEIIEQNERLISQATPLSSPVIPHIEQVGPFTYRQIREKFNIVFDKSNETVLYDQRKSWQFEPELSIIKSEQELEALTINHISTSLAGTTLNPVFAEAINPTVVEHNLKLFLKHTARELLFEGYPDILMEQAKAAGQVDMDRFGWFVNLNNSITPSMRVYTGPSNATLDKFGSMDLYKSRGHLDVWQKPEEQASEVRCNQFKYSSAGEFFPPPPKSLISHHNQWQRHHDMKKFRLDSDMTILDYRADATGEKFPGGKQSDASGRRSISSNLEVGSADDKNGQSNQDSQQSSDQYEVSRSSDKSDRFISIFFPDLCRTFELYYNKTYDYDGLTVDRYKADKFTYNYNMKPTKKQLVQYTLYLNQTINLSSINQGLQQSNGNEINNCFCVYNEFTNSSSCPPNGLLDLYSCRKGSPIMISFPHFLYSRQDPTLKPYLELFVDKHEANEEEHSFYFDLESTMNIPVQAQVGFQFNVRLRNDQNLNFTSGYTFLFDMLANRPELSQDFYLPQMWVQSKAIIDPINLRNLKFLQHNLKLVTPIVTVIMFAIASILLAASAKMAYLLTYGPRNRKCSGQWPGTDEREAACVERTTMLNGSPINSSSSSSNNTNMDANHNHNNFELTDFVRSKD